MLTSTSISAPLPPLPSKRKSKPKAPNTAAIWDSLATARSDNGKGKEKEKATDGDKETEEHKQTAKEKENANELGEKDLNGKEVSLSIDPVTLLRTQTRQSMVTLKRKRETGTATVSERREKQARFAPLSINGHTPCTPAPLLDESISAGLSRRSKRLNAPYARKPSPEPAKLPVSLNS